MDCPFCSPLLEGVVHEGRLAIALRDAFPVTEGHTLVVPRRHLPDWFATTEEERAEILHIVDKVRAGLVQRYGPLDFNLGINNGPAAGQTVQHVHVHVIPRRAGDVEDPRGGVRHVIPERGNYLAESRSVPYEVGRPTLPPAAGSPLVAGGVGDPLLPHLRAHLDHAQAADLAVAFILDSGVDLLEPQLIDLLDRGGTVHILTGDYLDVTAPSALRRLLDLDERLPGRLELRVFETHRRSFHPKSYIFHDADGTGVAYVGSSNLTRPALTAGVEWNYRVVPSTDRPGFDAVAGAFDDLFGHHDTRAVDLDWVDDYEQRRRPPAREAPVEVASELPLAPPSPHGVQQEAITALRHTREKGNAAGLVVLATGLGKTWLAAFDSEQVGAERVLFVAHREEILRQALTTFRRIRPQARLGFYTGADKVPDADVLFASVQTLNRARHLRVFAPDAFDYVVVDEFHHAAARTYRRLLDHFRPGFLLGLTATPERSDGGDLLALCGENLVYRCDLVEGIRRGLLAPFHYFGIPDEVDYAQIPWRSGRFDEQVLEQALATQRRADNALDQHRRRGGSRTLAFCASQRHADFMKGHFAEAGLRVTAVHSGSGSDPRATSLERLEAGELDVVFAVDMFNEGVDVPDIDTVMMLRPTESRIVWLQQFGRGLRTAEGKSHVTVIDYVGNHRTFLLRPQLLLDVAGTDAALDRVLTQLAEGTFTDLPPGCELTYELEAIDVLRGLLRTASHDVLRNWYERFREEHVVRPTAVEAMHEGFAPRSARRRYGSWFGFVEELGDLREDNQAVLAEPQLRGFLESLESTPMTKSYKMLVLLGMMRADALPGSLGLDDLSEQVEVLAERSAALQADLGEAASDRATLRRLLVGNPIAAWTGGRGTGNVAYFAYQDEVLRTALRVPEHLREAFVEMVRELAEWRLAEYLQRRAAPSESAGRFTCNVSHSGGKPILFLPDRGSHPQVPEGWTRVLADGVEYEANFVKVAVNVMRRRGERDNVLADVLRAWFGEHAGLPGTGHRVEFEKGQDDAWVMRAQSQTGADR